MMEERGINVDHTTLYRWVQTYPPQIEKRPRWHRQGSHLDGSWRVDETYVKVKGKWKYLYRAVNAHGGTIDFYLSHTRNINAATIFLKKALRGVEKRYAPGTITTDKNPTYEAAIARVNAERKKELPIEHRTVKYLNNIIESDHGKLKRLIKPTLGFKSMKTA
jgi:IS6 family transposase